MDDPLSQIRDYVVENFLFGDGSSLEDDTSFLESGIIDSMGFLELVTYLEETYGISVDDTELVPDNFDSLTRIAKYVAGKVEGASVGGE